MDYWFNDSSDNSYDCSEMEADEWSSSLGQVHELNGVLSIMFGVIVMVLYGLCVVAFCSKKLIGFSCYKIMFCMGVVDMAVTFIDSILHGYLLIDGAVFCSYPKLIYSTGQIVTGMWATSCILCLILVINRLMCIVWPTAAELVFSPVRTYIILAVTFLYGMYFIVFTRPALFNSKYQSWLLSPHIPSRAYYPYTNRAHTFNNFGLVGFTCCLYTFFCVSLRQKVKNSVNSSKHNQIFIQSTIICLLNFSAGVTYSFMNVFSLPEFMFVVGHVLWQVAQGCPPLIYLIMNNSVRLEVRKLFVSKNNQVQITSVVNRR